MLPLHPIPKCPVPPASTLRDAAKNQQAVQGPTSASDAARAFPLECPWRTAAKF